MSSVASHLRLSNGKLRTLVLRLREPDHATLITAELLTEPLEELGRTAEWVRSAPQSSTDTDLAREISECRHNLTELSQVLPSLRGRLLAEKSRLEAVRKHVAAATAWAHASKRSL
jgi:hypothetical protein